MTLELDEAALRSRLAKLLDDPTFRLGLDVMTSDPFFVTFFLASVSQGEGLGAAAIALIGQEELASRIRDLERQELEERGHKEQTIEAARELFPEFFLGDRYRYEHALMGRPYYLAALEANRAQLKMRERYSRLNLYLTTTFGYEVMVVLLYRAVAETVARAALPAPVRMRVSAVLDRILVEEETHLGVLDQHAALLAAPRSELSPDARSMLDALEKLRAEDYAYPAELSVEQVVGMIGRYADAEGFRAEIESGASAG